MAKVRTAEAPGQAASGFTRGCTTSPLLPKQSIPFTQNKVYLKAECEFRDKADTARFFYSLNGKAWKPVGVPLKMVYTIPHFKGYRFGFFNYATKEAGGYADFDYFRLTNAVSD